MTMPETYQGGWDGDTSLQQYLEDLRYKAVIVSDPGDEQEHIYGLL